MNVPVITPSHLFQYATQPLWIWYDLFGDASCKEPISDFAMKLLEDGVTHEEQIIQDMPIKTVSDTDPGTAAQTTLELMKRGEPLIYQGSINAEINCITYRGRPDLLERIKGTSNLGDWRYRPIDIKSSGSVKPLQRCQLIIYGWILDAILGTDTDTGEIINREGKHLPVDLTTPKDQAKVAQMCSAIAEIMKGKRPPINVSSGAKNSPWYKEMLREAISIQDISLIYKLDGRSIATLHETGISTVPQLLNADIQALPPIPFAPAERLRRAQLQAQSLVENRLIWLDTPDLGPDADLMLYFDIEGDPWKKVEYLFGFWVVGDPDKKLVSPTIQHRTFEETPDKYFVYFLAESPSDEEKLWRDFLKWIDTLPVSYQVVHYADYERSHLNSLATKYGDSEARQKFMDRLVDLEKVVQKSVILPLYFYSIKDIAKSDFLGFKWRHEKAGGGQSIFWYEEWLETGNREVLDDIINYNEDDVRATENLYLWLLNQGKPP